FVRAITGIDYMNVRREVRSDKLRYPGRMMPNNKGIDLHCFQHANGIEDRFPLRHAAPRSGKADDVCAQPACCKLEGNSRAGRIFEEKIRDRPAFEQFLLVKWLCTLQQLYVMIAAIEQVRNGFDRQRFNAEKVLTVRNCWSFAVR